MSSQGPGCEMADTPLVCKRKVPAHLLMCYPHWSQVPKGTQRQVWDAVNGPGVGSVEYNAAVAAAVAAVLERNGVNERSTPGPPEGP